jgi:hypothetical protein
VRNGYKKKVRKKKTGNYFMKQFDCLFWFMGGEVGAMKGRNEIEQQLDCRLLALCSTSLFMGPQTQAPLRARRELKYKFRWTNSWDIVWNGARISQEL